MNEQVDYWKFYYSDNVQDAADFWSVERILKVMNSPSSMPITVMAPTSKQFPKEIRIKLRGKCQDRQAAVMVMLYRENFTDSQKFELQKIVADRYPGGGTHNCNCRQWVALALGTPQVDKVGNGKFKVQHK